MKPEQTPDPEAVIDAMAPVLGLVVKPDYRPAVIANLKICFAFAALIDNFPLDDHEEPAPVFTP